MATGKTEKARRQRQGDLRDGNLRVKGENFYRDAKKVKHLNMYKSGVQFVTPKVRSLKLHTCRIPRRPLPE